MDKQNNGLVRIKDATGVSIFHCNICEKYIAQKINKHLVGEEHW